MSIDPDHLAAAMRVTQQFGPERARPNAERLRERHPEISEALHGELFGKCAEIEDAAYELGERMREQGLSFSEAAEQLGATFPELPTDIVERAINQGAYSAAK